MEENKLERLIEKYRNVKIESVYFFSEISKSYKEYAQFVFNNRIYFGFERLDKMLNGITPGEVCYIIASTNVGKTQIAFHILDHNHKNKNICIPFFSLENSEFQIYERIIQFKTGISTYEIEKRYAQEEPEFITKCDNIANDYDNIINIVDRVRLEDLMPYLQAIRELTGKPIGVVLIDYAQLIKTTQQNEYMRMSEVSQIIKEVSLKLKVPIIVLSQVSRFESKADEGL